MDAWLEWIDLGVAAARRRRVDKLATLQHRVAELEAQVARLQGS
jgi:BMFP domain-containing protein YqiC